MSLIALGVTGGIGAYKAVEVARGLQKAGHDVVAVMTRNARRFVGPLTFEAITRRPVITSQWTAGTNATIEHIELATSISLLLVAPATANILGKFANGIADEFLSALYLATRAPVLVAPSMNTNMLEHPAVRANIEMLGSRGVRFVEPGEGFLACGWVGKGRLAEPDEIVAAAMRILQPNRSLAGRAVLVTAGPTYEDLDPVRYVGNRSSGRMGYALAAEAARRGADVTLISGPTSIEPPAGPTTVVRVRSAAEMHQAVTSRAGACDIVIMAAAVADYTPEQSHPDKITKTDGPMVLRLARTRDILADLGADRQRRAAALPVLVGFAAETSNLVARARQKLASKHIDLVVANDVSQPGAGFEVATNVVTLVDAAGEQALPLQQKERIAAAVLDRAESLLAAVPAVRK
jgi:phosphopantothenoylcysteine decarboxylase / phosphopantothenate---cysteine ligase